MNKQKAVFILGQTGTGKSALSLELCRIFGGEIISSDSMQVYRRMDIGTAKPSREELALFPHHLIDIRDIDQSFCAADFVSEAKSSMKLIKKNGHVPFIVGGTGLYTDMLLNSDNLEAASKDPDIRAELQQRAESEGVEALHRFLITVDPKAAQSVHPNNIKRVIRYLEIYLSTGLTPTQAAEQNNASEKSISPLIICLNSADTGLIYDRIDCRVDKMLERGLLDEAQSLWQDGLGDTPTASAAIGYKELFPFFRGEAELDSCVMKIKQYSRNYAKRQKAYFKRMNGVKYIDISKDAVALACELTDSFLNGGEG